ncbi:histidine kinase [Blautia liquoris]|uniref:Histidine kinase n=1 Tax=Blautia liquoris TaxID=2779518 RepID=A0A7M2RK06_9FIRM|nr:histidine kinase [Blautia liquoris]QOV20391.1 histidine kinase [Blautia liquoris]
MMKRFLIKRCKSFFLIMLIPIIILTIISTIFLYRQNTKSIIQASGDSLTVVRDNLEMVLSTSTYQYELLTYNPRMVLSMEKLLNNEEFEYTDVIFLNSVKASLSAIAQAHTYIDCVYLYLDGYDNYFSSEAGITSLSANKDKEWKDMYLSENSGKHLWIEKREFSPYRSRKPTRYITMFQRMSNVKGVIVVNIDCSKFEKLLSSAGLDGSLLFLSDLEGNVLASNQGDILPDKLISGQKRSRWTKYKDSFYLSQTVTSPSFNITFSSYVPFQYVCRQLLPTLIVLTAAVISNCLISLFLAYQVTKRNFQQINAIIHTFDEAEKGQIPPMPSSAVHDEYDVIMNNVISVYLHSTQLKHQLSERQHEQEMTEIASLQHQINPHFLFNTLQVLDFEALELAGGPCKLNRMLHNLSDILKYSLEDPSTPVLLKDELDHLKKYMEIQKERLGDRFIIYYEVAEDSMTLPVFRLMLQPLLENSLSHGISGIDSIGYLKVKIHKRNDKVLFAVLDNGIGLSQTEIHELYERISNTKSRNIGLTNINRRLILNYGPDSALHIQSKKNMGTCISFQIPMRTEDT